MTRDELAQKARKELLQSEKRSAVAVLREYLKLSDRLQKEIDFLINQIAVAESQGELSVNFIIEKNRLKNILDAVNREIERSSLTLGRITEKTQTKAIGIAKKQIENTAELDSNVFSFDNEAVKKMAGQSALGSPLDVYFERLARPLRQSMFSILTNGIATGKPSPEIAKELTNSIKLNSVNALAIVRNETNRVYREATLDFYQSANIKKWRWVAALDLHTCPVCWSYHGKVFKTKTPFASHVNCRCVMVPVLPGDPPSETGAERFDALNEAQQLTILGKGRFELFKRGANLPAFVQTNKTPFGLSRTLKNVSDVKFKEKSK